MTRFTFFTLAVVVLACAGASTAYATPRYATPGGSGTACTSESPCSVQTAVNGAVDNDEVILAPGTHSLAASVFNDKKIDVHGAAGAPRPLISVTGGNFVLVGRATLRHVGFLGDNNGLPPIGFDGELMEDVVVRAPQTTACTVGASSSAWTVTVRNSVCWSGAGPGLFFGQGVPNQTIVVRNVTSYGVTSTSFSPGNNNGASTYTVTNSILRPGVTGSVSSGTAMVNLSHDNFATKTGSVTYNDDNTSSTLPPSLADVSGGDFHQLSTSPTVDAGIDNAANGSFDFDGDVRAIGQRADVGADEYAPPPGAVTGSATGIGPTSAQPEGTVTPNGAATSARFEWGPTAAYGNSTSEQTLDASTSPTVVTAALDGLTPSTTYHFRVVATSHAGTTLGADQTFMTAAPPTGGPDPTPVPVVPPDTVAPVLGSFRLTNRAFTVGPKATPLAARAPRGSAFRFVLSEPAAVVIRIDRALRGVRKGNSCVKPVRGRHGKRCTRFVNVGQLKRAGVAGTNKVPFSGRLGTRALKTGSYRAVAVATDAAGNRSEKAAAKFKIVRR